MAAALSSSRERQRPRRRLSGRHGLAGASGRVLPCLLSTLSFGDVSNGDDDPVLRRRRLKSAHEADLEPARGLGHLRFACELCRLAFTSEESVKAHHGNRSDVFLTMHVDPRYEQNLVETIALAQAAAIVREARRRPDA